MIQRLILTLILVVSTPTWAAPICSVIFEKQKTEVLRLVSENAFIQWRLWEQTENYAPFKKDTKPVDMEVALIPIETVNIAVFDSTPPEILRTFVRGDFVLWPKHPYNSEPSVPHYFTAPISNFALKAHFTASRSMSLNLKAGAYTVKVGTNRPHGAAVNESLAKATTREDIDKTLLRTHYLEGMDSRIGHDPQLVIAKDILTVADKTSGQGYLIRDMTFLNDGFYYLPAFSIPYIGRKIAKLHGRSAADFWGEHYSVSLGRAKAKLLLRYGLQMETPNPQNMLIQLDRNLTPTGVLVFRDLSDTVFFEPAMLAFKDQETLKKEREKRFHVPQRILRTGENSHWRFNEANENSFTNNEVIDMIKFHNVGFKREVESSLNVRIPQVGSSRLTDVEAYLLTEAGQKKLNEYNQRLIRNHQTKTLQRAQ